MKPIDSPPAGYYSTATGGLPAQGSLGGNSCVLHGCHRLLYFAMATRSLHMFVNFATKMK